MDALDPALRRAGRFNREVCLGIPDAAARLQILQLLSAKMRLAPDVNLELIAKNTPGFVGADLVDLLEGAVIAAGKRMFQELKDKHKLEIAIAKQKLLERQQELEAKRMQEEQEAKQREQEKETPSESDKGELEIIVDGDSKDKTDLKPASDEHNDTNDSAVVVIDDDVKQTPDDGAPISQPEVPDSNQEEAEFQKKLLESDRPLDELRSCLHTFLSSEQLESLQVGLEDFQTALKLVQPSAKREGFATVPDVTWDDIGSLSNIREELQMDILVC